MKTRHSQMTETDVTKDLDEVQLHQHSQLKKIPKKLLIKFDFSLQKLNVIHYE